MLRKIGRRTWKRLGLLLLAALAMGPTWFFLHDRAGERKWKRWMAAEKAKGNKLHMADYLPVSVPDDENFAKLPIFDEAGPATQVRQMPFYLPEGKRPGLAEPRLDLPFDIQGWHSFLTSNGWITASTDNPALDVIQAFHRFQPDIDVLKAGLSRPHTYFSANTTIPLPNPSAASVYQRIQLALSVRANAFIDLGDSAAALDDLLLILAIMRRFEREPAILAHLIRTSTAPWITMVLYHGLHQRAWSDEQLGTIISELESIDLIAQLSYAVETERAYLNDLYDWHAQTVKSRPMKFSARMITDQTAWFTHDTFLRAFPGIIRRNQIRLYEYFVQYGRRLDVRRKMIRQEVPRPEGGRCTCHPGWNPYYQLFYFTATELSGVEQRTLTSCCMLRLAILACALERYHMAAGRYPESLADLAPTYLRSVPREPTSIATMCYSLTADGRYNLYSRGLDGNDDNGVLRKRKARKGEERKMPRPYETLDFPWPAPPLR